MRISNMKDQKKNYIALLVALVLVVSTICGTTAFAAEPWSGTSEELVISDFNIEPISDFLRTARGYNYNFNVGDSSGNIYGAISGTVIFDYNNETATVQSAGTPKVTVYDNTVKITANAAGATEGTTAVVTINVTMTKLLVFSNSMTAKIKCSKVGTIWVE